MDDRFFEAARRDGFGAVQAAFRGWDFNKQRYTSTSNDGGQVRMVRRAGAVESNSFKSRKKRKLTVHQKAHAAYAMAKDMMPRTKSVSFVMYRHNLLPSFTQKFQYSGITGTNTATELNDRSGSETPYNSQNSVIPSGHSMCSLEDVDKRNMVSSSIFPLSHVNLISKGDNFNQRLGDFVELIGMHIVGRISCQLYSPNYGDPSAGVYVASDVGYVGRIAGPPAFDQTRKVRFMLVEVFDHVSATESKEDSNTDPLVYRNASWGSATTEMQVVGAPRLSQILEVDSFPNIRSNSGVRNIAEHGRWNKIDRKYRSNHKNENLYLDPDTGRAIDFRVLKDISFTLKPDTVRTHETGDTALRGASSVGKTSYVDVDMFVKLNKELSYKTHDADASGQELLNENASRTLFWYLFDDHMDCLSATGSVNPSSNPTAGQGILAHVIMDGYAMCTADLKCDIYFNDDL